MASARELREIIAVHPTGWENEVAEQTIELSAFDHLMPKIYVLMVLVFRLPEISDKRAIIDNLRRGLEVTLSMYPALAGTLQSKNDNTLFVVRKKEQTVNLTINHIDDEQSMFPSYNELNQKDFPAILLDGPQLIPKAATETQLFRGDNAEKDTFISAFQVNFIKGGIILGVAVHHNVSDGPGCDGFLSTWAENSRALANGTPIPPFDSTNLDRSRLSSNSSPDAARMAELQRKLPAFKHVKEPPAPPPADFLMPKLIPVMWHFPTSKLEKLKALCKPKDGMSWVSTYDCIMGLLYKTMTRAKIPMLNPDMASESTLMHAVNNRQMLDPPLPGRFLGNAVSLASTDRSSIQSILDMSPAQAAALVRGSITKITPESIHELAEWVAGTPDKSWIGMNLNAFFGMDLAGTSWTKMTSYTSHDFGFGLPQAVRFPKPDWEGYVFVYPRRVKDNPEEGFECCVCLEEECQRRLMADEEILEFASPRGL